MVCGSFDPSSCGNVLIIGWSRCQSTGTGPPRTRRNLLDNASNLLTNLLCGGDLGSMPTAEGAVSDLFDRPLFFSLYDWFIEVLLGILLSSVVQNCIKLLINCTPIPLER